MIRMPGSKLLPVTVIVQPVLAPVAQFEVAPVMSGFIGV